MTELLGIRPVGDADRRALAAARLVSEFDALWRRLVSLAGFRYRLGREDCEEIVADTLLAWYQELCRTGAVRIDAAYLMAVLHHRALDRKKALGRNKRAAVETVPLADGDAGNMVDPQLDDVVAEREELHDLAELAKDVLSQRELEIMLLSRHGVARAEIAKRYGLSVRAVERCLARAQHKLDDGIAVMSARGRCGMLALTVSDIKTGRIGPGHPRYDRGIAHLKRCHRCRTSAPIPTRQPVLTGRS
jgi:DNA-directed RNA polymerase specialized sigma24 family protein